MDQQQQQQKRAMNESNENNSNWNDQLSPAKRQRMNVNENASVDQSVRLKCGYVSEMTRRLYLNEEKADVHFKFQNQQIPAHKFILSLASSIFNEMCSSPSSSIVPDDLLIFKYSAETFKDFLQFFYLNEVTLKSSNIAEVVHLLHAHQMLKCLELCSRFWLEHYDRNNIDDICLAYEYALKLKEPEFREFCEHAISAYPDEVFKTDGFLACPFGVLDRILTLDSLLCDESVILTACLDWARHQCEQNGKDANDVKNLREYLTNHSNGGNLLYKIRFGSILKDEISNHLEVIDGILVDAKVRTDITRLLLGSTNLESGKFQAEPRKSLWIDEHAVDYKFPKEEFCREQEAKQRNLNVLKTSRTILFGGFYMVQMKTLNLKSFEIPINVSIEEHRSGGSAAKLIHKECVKVFEHSDEFVQLKPKPIVMKQGYEYHIEFHFDDETISESSDSISFCDVSRTFRTVELNENLTIQCYSKNPKDHLFIRGFKFIEL